MRPRQRKPKKGKLVSENSKQLDGSSSQSLENGILWKSVNKVCGSSLQQIFGFIKLQIEDKSKSLNSLRRNRFKNNFRFQHISKILATVQEAESLQAPELQTGNPLSRKRGNPQKKSISMHAYLQGESTVFDQ